MRRLSRLVFLALSAILMLLYAGKILWLPIAIIGPSESLPPFIGVASYLSKGNITLYCIDDLRSACSTGGGKASYVRAIPLPFLLWAALSLLTPLIVGFSVLLSFRRFRVLLALLAGIVAIDLVAISSLYIDQSAIDRRIPAVELESVSVSRHSNITIRLKPSPYLIESATCKIEGERAEVIVGHNDLNIRIPPHLIESMYSRRAAERLSLPSPPASIEQMMSISCEIELDKGRLIGSYGVPIRWEEPIIYATGSSAVIANRLPVNLNAIVEIYGGEIFRRMSLELKPLEEREVKLSDLPRGRYEVRILYRFLGHERGQGVVVENR